MARIIRKKLVAKDCAHDVVLGIYAEPPTRMHLRILYVKEIKHKPIGAARVVNYQDGYILAPPLYRKDRIDKPTSEAESRFCMHHLPLAYGVRQLTTACCSCSHSHIYSPQSLTLKSS